MTYLRPAQDRGDARFSWLKSRHSLLLVVHLEQLNFSPRAAIGGFLALTEAKDERSTAPRQRGIYTA